MAAIDSSFLTAYQRGVLQEVRAKKNGAIHIPMGGGKTAISITLCLENTANCPSHSPSIVVVSKSLIPEWIKELEKFFPGTSYHILHKDSDKEYLTRDISSFSIVLTTPETMQSHLKHYQMEGKIAVSTLRESDLITYINYPRPINPLGSKVKGPIFSTLFSTLIIDEGSKYLNPTTKRTRALIGIAAKHKWILSATLLSEPKPDNIFGYTLLIGDPNTPRNRPDFLIYMKSPQFRGVGYTLVKREKNEDYNPDEIGQTITHEVITNSFTKEEADFFLGIKSIIREVYIRFRELKKAQLPQYREELKLLRGMLLGMISHLRLTLVCPLIPITSMYLGMAEMSDRHELVNSFTSELLKQNPHWLDNEEAVYSSRLRKVIELVQKHPNERVVIFSAFRTTLDVLEHYIPDNRELFSIKGTQTLSKRYKSIENWENSESGIILLTYEVGACGLNLQKGTVAIVMDYGWDMDVTKQAVGRIVRRGQTAESIKIYYLTSNTGVEKAIYSLHQSKHNVSKQMEEGGTIGTITKLKISDMVELISMEDNLEILNDIYTK